MSAQAKLNDILMEWQHETSRFRGLVEDEARAKTHWAYWSARKRAEVRAETLAAGDKLTVQDLNDRVLNADEDGLFFAAELAESAVVGSRKALDLWSARADATRSEVATERAADQLHAAAPAPKWATPGEWA